MKNFKIYLIALTIILTGVVYNTAPCYSETENQEISVKQTAKEDMEDYIALTRKKIKNNWYPPTDQFENFATLVVKINKKGELESCKLAAPSPSEGFNNSLIEAANKTKFSPLPESYKRPSVELGFDFGMQRHTVSK